MMNSFLTKAKITHGEYYDYSKVLYINTRTKVEIVCPIHGIFTQTPTQHITNQAGCPKCAAEKIKAWNVANAAKTVIDRWLKALSGFRKTHGDRYDYSRVVPGNYSNKRDITIICSIHGPFDQRPLRHKLGAGCPQCGRQKGLIVRARTLEETSIEIKEERARKARVNRKDSKRRTEESVFTQAAAIHEGKYLYHAYKGMQHKMVITCPAHGDFEQLPKNHIHVVQGCPKCSGTSKAEKQLFDFVKSLNPNTCLMSKDKKVLRGKELDIYLPEYKLAIEYNGLYFHSSSGSGLKRLQTTDYHQDKMLACRAAGISLLQIFEDEWLNPIKQEIWKSVIKHKVGLTKSKIYARKCTLVELNFTTCSRFLEDNHLMGKDSSPIRHGLTHDGKLVSVITFSKPSLSGGNKKYDWNIGRFSVLKDTTVVGGFSKLLQYFLRLHPGVTLSTAADLRYSVGDVYTKNGFKLTHETRPNYWYWNQKMVNKRFHRFGFRKQMLEKKLEMYDPNITEKQNMVNNGWNIIHDAGNVMFELVYLG